MADDLHQRGSQDRSRISLSEDWEVAYWTKELGVSEDELVRLVHRHGNVSCRGEHSETVLRVGLGQRYGRLHDVQHELLLRIQLLIGRGGGVRFLLCDL